MDVTTKEVTLLASGFLDIEALAVGSDGHFVVADYDGNANKLTFFERDGTLRDSFIGLRSPKGLLFDAEGQLLVAKWVYRSGPGLAKARDDGYLEPFSSAVSSVEFMWLEDDGQITVSGGSGIVTLSKTGEQQNTFQTPAYIYLKGLHRDTMGNLWIIAEHNGVLLKMAPDGSTQQMASGLSKPTDIEVDSKGIPHITDYNRGVVLALQANNSLSLVATDLLKAEALTFAPDGTLFVAYGDKRVAKLAANGERSEKSFVDLITQKISGISLDDQGNIYFVMLNTDQMLKVVPSQTATIEPGEVLYTATATLPTLSLEGEAVTVDFGERTLTLSGDFELQVTATSPVTAQVSNTLHVGPSAHGTLSLIQSQVFPGDRTVTASLTLQGADSTSVTQIDPEGTTLAAASGTLGYGIAADNQGNIYSFDRGRIVKITPDGTVSDFVTGITSVGYGLAIDAQDNIYVLSGKNILKIIPPTAEGTTPRTSDSH